MIGILDRYLIKEILSYFLISLFALTGILLTLRMLKFAALIINRGVAPIQIVEVFLAIIPTFLEIAIPLACLLGVMLAFARLSGDSELVVMRASGISLFRILIPVICLALVITSAGLYVSLVLRPWGFNKLSDSLFQIARARTTSGLSPGVFNKLGVLTLYAETINYQNGDLTRVFIDDKRDPAARRIIISDTGQILSDAETQNITLFLESGVIHEQVNDKYVLTNFKENSLVISPDEIFQNDSSKKVVSQRELSTPDLRNVLAQLRSDALDPAPSSPPPVSTDVAEQKNQIPDPGVLTPLQIQKKYRRYKLELGQRFSLPFASLVMAVLGMALGILPPRAQKTWGAGLSATLGLVVFVIYYSIFSLGLALAEQGALRIWLALWFPNVILLILACFLVYKIASEKWQSVIQGIPFSKISNIFFWKRVSRS